MLGRSISMAASISFFFFFSSRRRHTRLQGDWSSDVCSSDLSRDPASALHRDCVGGRGRDRTSAHRELPRRVPATLALRRGPLARRRLQQQRYRDRKSTRLNSSHLVISYAVFCLKKKKKKEN